MVSLGQARYIATIACGFLCASSACAQPALDASVASENNFRGNSLSDGDPVAAFSMNADSSSGWFAGALASSARFDHYQYRSSSPQWVADVGYARSTEQGWSWELGATGTWFSNASFYNYHELFAGLSINNWNARIFYSPAYYGLGFKSVYVELNYVRPLTERLHLLAHAGLQHADLPMAAASDVTFDTRLGLGLQIQRLGLQASWVATNRGSYLQPIDRGSLAHKLLVQVDYAF